MPTNPFKSQAEWRAKGCPQPHSSQWNMLVRQKESLLKRKVQKLKEKEINKEFTDIFFGNNKTVLWDVGSINHIGERDMTVDEVVNKLWNVTTHNPNHSWRATLCEIVMPMIEYDKETMKYQSTNPHIKLFGEVIKKFFDQPSKFYYTFNCDTGIITNKEVVESPLKVDTIDCWLYKWKIIW